MTRLPRMLIPAALGVALVLTAAAGTAGARVPIAQQHQFQQAMLPTDTPGAFRLGIWVFNRANGRIRLCVLNDEAEAGAPVMKCSTWTGSGPAGLYYLMQIRRHPRQPGRFRAGLWILNRASGHTRACVITDMKDPTGTLRCSKIQ
ncbi:MAG TPA: hypothetical protein VM325_19700 [Alphaproteobacteria bacterium]|nr:hypothetical protein [Alphaproteobacteria bacterium]